ncbi:MAG: pyruvate, phosphate dikinase, partial [Rhodothermales bacterium]|nr:pyruvate, phosphate dikinase [Rhodothermales bacterium]
MPTGDSQLVFVFGNSRADGDRTMKSLLGGKGANLAEMSAIGLPVPPGFTICTKVCHDYDESGRHWPDGLRDEVARGIEHIESAMGQGFGDTENPLLVSVRSGAAVSMPGMMDSVLNLGINDAVVAGLVKKTGNARFAYDAYRRFIDMFGDVVMGVPHQAFEDVITHLKSERGAKSDVDLNADDLKLLVERYKSVYEKHVGEPFPDSARKQLTLSINAVLNSWNSDRAVKYRRINQITGLIGTAVNVQAMVYGDLNDNSGTGVCFTRDPGSGKPGLFGEFLINAQGEDVVAGIRTPTPISRLEEVMPGPFAELSEWARKLEQHYRDVQDMEFTIQDGELFILQTRSGKRTGHAAIKIAVDLV